MRRRAGPGRQCPGVEPHRRLTMALDVAKFLEQFFLEAKEKLTFVQNFLVQLEQNPRDADALLGIQRDMHTIKGSARMVGLKEISELSHRMEDVFAQLHGRQTEVGATVMEALYEAIDALGEMVRAAQAGQPPPPAAALLNKLQAVLKVRPAASPTPAADAGKRHFSLDLAALRRSVQAGQSPPEHRRPQRHATREPAVSAAVAAMPAEAEAVTPAAAGKPEPPPPQAPPPGPSAATAAPAVPRVRERQFLKVDSENIENIINQLTDLLSKRYFFSNVLHTFKGLQQVAEGFRREWQPLKSRLGNSEAADNIETMLDLLARNVVEFERGFQANLTDFEGTLRDIYDNLLDIKLTPISSIFSVYPRYVRDYAQRSGKKIRLFVRGGDSQLDKTIIEKISEPLVHLLRNACDHGIEAPAERERLGKDSVGTIVVESNKKGNRVEIRIQDDGCGLDRDAILKTAIRRGLIDEKLAAGLEDSDVFDFIFEPGFSTARAVSDSSGRGIGMDIVKRTVSTLNGSLAIVTRKGQGTTFILEFPIAIFTTQVMFVCDAGVTYALPSNLIRQIVRLDSAAVRQEHDYATVVHGDEIYTVARLGQVLGGEGQLSALGTMFMILPKAGERRIGILVDDILHENEVIIKELGPFLGKRRYVSGVLIGERGELFTVLDLHDVASLASFSRRLPADKAATHAPARVRRKVLVVDDSLLVREMEKNVLEMAGYEVVTAINGLDGYNKAISDRFDLILADIEMPEMDGFELIENVRKIRDYAEVPVIVLSIRDREQDKVRGIHVGASAWLSKQDFDDREFLRVVRSFIG